jgi:hypothetical protein
MNKSVIPALAITAALAFSACGGDGGDVVADCTDDASAEAAVLIYGSQGDYDRLKQQVEANIAEDGDDPFTWKDFVYTDIDGGNFLSDFPSTYHDGDTYVIDGAFQQDDSGDLPLYSKMVGATMNCVLDGLDTPPAVRKQIEQTSAMDGIQTVEFDGASMMWTYHPDEGMFMTIDA